MLVSGGQVVTVKWCCHLMVNVLTSGGQVVTVK